MAVLDFQTLISQKLMVCFFFFIQDLYRQMAICKRNRLRFWSLHQVYNKLKMPNFFVDIDCSILAISTGLIISIMVPINSLLPAKAFRIELFLISFLASEYPKIPKIAGRFFPR